jgi:osmotically inducible lipoprotein OsmB
MKETCMNPRRSFATYVIAIASLLSLAGCSGMTRQERDTVIGAGVGGVAGSALSGGSAVGTVGGAAVGGVIGHEVGKNK